MTGMNVLVIINELAGGVSAQTLEKALKGTPHRIDIGRINDRYFALMAGAGLDAEIMAGVHPIEKKAMGVVAYFWKGVQKAFRTPYAVFEIEADGRHIRARGIGV